MSEDYEKFHEIPPFKVKADPNTLLNDEDYPWLRRNKQGTHTKKKWRLSLHNYSDDSFDLEYHSSYMLRNEMPFGTDEFSSETLYFERDCHFVHEVHPVFSATLSIL